MKRIVNQFLGKCGKRASPVLVLCAATAIALPAQVFTTLVNFNGANGSGPYFGSLVQGIDGNFYGETVGGGANNFGTVFRFDAKGTLTTLHNFDETDGWDPVGGLVQATNGNFYGATDGAYGTIFEITPSGALTTLHSFLGMDGSHPWAGLVQATDGRLYGTTGLGGSHNHGTIFSITPQSQFVSLHSFDLTDGSDPTAGLAEATNGNFYGTTLGGGADGNGTVFEMTPQGTLTAVLSFDAFDGGHPHGALIQALDGNLYGTTTYGGAGAPAAQGTVFEITTRGTLTTMYSFNVAGGCEPYDALVQATDGNFYGTTNQGGSYGWGTVFKITPAGTLTTLHNFDSPIDGNFPYGGLLQGTDGDLYGTTYGGGAGGAGTVFRLSLGLGPFVKALPATGKVGAVVRVLGTSLTGATSVSFNGVAASFTVNSSGTAISAVVPVGATTGIVKVVTTGGTLSSNVPFRVL
jgi:uncharacterized repeat protein (TIGR03803 family)